MKERETKSNIVEVAANYVLTGQLYDELKVVDPPNTGGKSFATAVYPEDVTLIPRDELYVAQIVNGAVVIAAPLFKRNDSTEISLEEAQNVIKWGKPGFIKGFFEMIGKNGEKKK